MKLRKLLGILQQVKIVRKKVSTTRNKKWVKEILHGKAKRENQTIAVEMSWIFFTAYIGKKESFIIAIKQMTEDIMSQQKQTNPINVFHVKKKFDY